MKKLLFSLILSLLPIASGAIQYEYFNPLMPQNGALKVNQTIGQLTPPQGKGFGVLSALTNLQSVASSIATNEYGIQVDTLGLVCPTEEAVVAAISAHNTDQSAHSYIQNRITVNDNAIAANADAIQKTREDFMAADTELQTQITSHAGELTTLRNDLDDLGDEVAVIEGKIPASTTSSNQLVNASQLTAESQDIRSEFAQADSELQQQINAHATAITNLEDGVDSINGKIPTNASTTNLLVSTSQLNTEIQDVRADFMADDAALQTQINGQATTIAGIQDDITGINSKISASASSTNKLISASELSATEQDIRADMNEADSQLQTQITAQAGSITTLRNDTDDLGDQVAGIEGKIPAAASSSNQLALNSQITSLQTQITTNTNNFTNYRTSAAQDVIDSNLQSQITNGLALKLDKDQGSENQGKILSVGSDGQITLTAAPGGGLQAVAHNSTLTGAGTDASPLGIANSVLSELADKADQTVVDALASTVSSIQTDYTPKATTTALSNTVSGIQSDYVSKTATAAQTIASSLQTPELTVGTAEGTLNLSIAAGVATIATNNGLDIISQTKFDTQPTTDDTTTWANATSATLVRKGQVADAVAAASAASMPTGTLIPFAGTTCPSGFIVANGGAVSRTTYANLFAVIGTTYGAGDGNSTFNLPNLDGRAPWYDSTATIGGISNGGLPNITGTGATYPRWSNNAHVVFNNRVDGAFSYKGIADSTNHGSSISSTSANVSYSTNGDLTDFDASRVSAVYDSGTTVRPAAVYTNWCVKF